MPKVVEGKDMRVVGGGFQEVFYAIQAPIVLLLPCKVTAKGLGFIFSQGLPHTDAPFEI